MKTKFAMVTALCGLGALMPISGAGAAVLKFNGTAMATASVLSDPTCQPLSNFRGTVLPPNGAGTSNLGAFSYSHSICTQGVVTPISYQDGIFAIAFANGSIKGTVTGSSTPTATPRVFDQLFTYVITGGTGQFLGASGTFDNIGTVDARTPPSRLSLAFLGTINAPGVPEPGAWALLIMGFGAVGAAMRAPRRRVQLVVG